MHTVWWHYVYFCLCFKPRLATRFQGPGSRFSKRIAFPTTAVVNTLCFVLCVEQKAGIKIHARFSNQLPDAVNLSNPGQRFCISHHEIQYLIFTLRERFSHYSTRKLFLWKLTALLLSTCAFQRTINKRRNKSILFFEHQSERAALVHDLTHLKFQCCVRWLGIFLPSSPDCVYVRARHLSLDLTLATRAEWPLTLCKLQ